MVIQRFKAPKYTWNLKSVYWGLNLDLQIKMIFSRSMIGGAVFRLRRDWGDSCFCFRILHPNDIFIISSFFFSLFLIDSLFSIFLFNLCYPFFSLSSFSQNYDFVARIISLFRVDHCHSDCIFQFTLVSLLVNFCLFFHFVIFIFSATQHG